MKNVCYLLALACVCIIQNPHELTDINAMSPFKTKSTKHENDDRLVHMSSTASAQTKSGKTIANLHLSQHSTTAVHNAHSVFISQYMSLNINQTITKACLCKLLPHCFRGGSALVVEQCNVRMKNHFSMKTARSEKSKP